MLSYISTTGGICFRGPHRNDGIADTGDDKETVDERMLSIEWIFSLDQL